MDHHHHHGGQEGYGGGYPQGQQGFGGQQGYGGQQGFGGGQRREFFIVSEMSGKVVDIERGNTAEGTKICIWDKHPDRQRNQIWYTDPQGFIHSALNDMVFSNGGHDQELKMRRAGSNDPRALWRLNGNKITNSVGEVLDAKGAKDHNGTELISYRDENHKNQMWRFEYL